MTTNRLKKALLIAFISVCSAFGLNVGTSNAAIVPYGLYATEIQCVNAGLGFLNDGSGDFRGYKCFQERSGQYHLYMDEY